jgi:single-strand DNA-binding protein
MASFELEGKLHEVFPTMQRTETFKTREFIVEELEGQYPQVISIQVTQDRCVLIDNFNVGDLVKVSFNIRGRAWSKDGRSGYITNLEAWRIERSGGSTQAAPPPAAAHAPAAPATPSAPAAPEQTDDLPF